MNIKEEISNIEKYLQKTEYKVELETKSIDNFRNNKETRNVIMNDIKKLEKTILSITSLINNYSRNKKKAIEKEKQIYLNENKRLLEKKKDLVLYYNICKKKEIVELTEKIVLLKLKKAELLENKEALAQYKKDKLLIRKKYANLIKNTTLLIKNEKKEIEKLQSYFTNNDNDVNRNDNDNTSNELMMIELKMEIAKRRNLIAGYKAEIHKLSKNCILPNLYKSYKAKIFEISQDIDETRLGISLSLNTISDYETKIEKVDEELEVQYERCNLRWSKMRDRLNTDIDNYKNSFKEELEKLEDEKSALLSKLEILNDTLKTESSIIDEKYISANKVNTDLIDNIKKRLKYLKKIN